MNYTLCHLETITQSEQKVFGDHGFAVVFAVVYAVVIIIIMFCVIIKRKTTFDTKEELIVSKAYLGREGKAYFDVAQFVIFVAAVPVLPPARRQRNVWS